MDDEGKYREDGEISIPWRKFGREAE